MKRRRQWGALGLLGLAGLGGMLAFGGTKPTEPDDNDDEPDDEGGGDDVDPVDDPSSGGGTTGGTPLPGVDDDDDPPTTGDNDDDDDGGDDPSTDEPSTDDPETPPAKPPRAPTQPRPPTEDDPPEDDPPEPKDKPGRAPLRRDGPPWSELVDPYPRGGTFYPVVRDDRFGGMSSKHSIAYRFLLSEAYLAALEYGGLSHEESLTWAAAVGKQDKVRLKVIDLYQCSGWNDAMYGANPVSVSRASAHGRSILLRPVHAPNADRLSNGIEPARNITMGGNPSDTDWRNFELLWSPAIDRVRLWDSGGIVVSTTGMLWADGSSMANPPPWVIDLGMEDATDLLEGSFGCEGSDGTVEF